MEQNGSKYYAHPTSLLSYKLISGQNQGDGIAGKTGRKGSKI
jgi:hypothetical protein